MIALGKWSERFERWLMRKLGGDERRMAFLESDPELVRAMHEERLTTQESAALIDFVNGKTDHVTLLDKEYRAFPDFASRRIR